MSKKIKKTEIHQGHCPKCGTPLEYLGSEIQDEFNRHGVVCKNKKCKWEGYEDYKMTFVSFWDTKTDKEIK